MLRGNFFVQSSVDVVQVSQNALRQLDNLLVPVGLGHLKQRRIEDRQNDGDVVTDHCCNVLIGPERQHSLGYLQQHTYLVSVVIFFKTTKVA